MVEYYFRIFDTVAFFAILEGVFFSVVNLVRILVFYFENF